MTHDPRVHHQWEAPQPYPGPYGDKPDPLYESRLAVAYQRSQAKVVTLVTENMLALRAEVVERWRDVDLIGGDG